MHSKLSNCMTNAENLRSTLLPSLASSSSVWLIGIPLSFKLNMRISQSWIKYSLARKPSRHGTCCLETKHRQSQECYNPRNRPRKSRRVYRFLNIHFSAPLDYSFNYIFHNYKRVHLRYSSEQKC